MGSNKVVGRDARRLARREARLEEKQAEAGIKSRPPMSARTRNILLIALAVLIVALGVVWFITDSNSYVATVDGRRIQNAEYQYFLKLQQGQVEAAEGLDAKTEEERKAYWEQDAVDGENPVLRVKNDALDIAKEYAIQLQQAREMGLSVDDAIRAQTQTDIESIRQSLGESYTANLADLGLTEGKYAEILRNFYLIDVFRSKYIEENYKAGEISADAVRDMYNTNPNAYDVVTARMIYLSKVDEEGNTLEGDALADKQALAEAIMTEIIQGADMETLAKERSDSQSVQEDGGVQELNYSMQPYMPEIIDWAFAANADELSVIDTTYGIFIVRVEGRTGFEEAESGLRTQMEEQAKLTFYGNALDGWMADPKNNLVLKERVFEGFTVQ
jgi:hypothetical protein